MRGGGWGVVSCGLALVLVLLRLEGGKSVIVAVTAEECVEERWIVQYQSIKVCKSFCSMLYYTSLFLFFFFSYAGGGDARENQRGELMREKMQ